MRRFASLSVALALIVGCSGGSTDNAGEPVLDSGDDSSSGDADETTSDTAVAPDSADTGDGFVACKADVDCASSTDGKVCDTASGKCVPCSATSDLCAPSEHCDGNKCVSGCKSDDGCVTATGDAGTDADGGDGGTSTKTKCETTSHTCVECVRDDQCAAGFLCVGNVCSAGCSTTKACPTGETCCASSCVSTVTNIDNCGACGTKCAVTGGSATCEASACKVATCSGTLADCDLDYANGCEVDKATSATNCGACGTVCSPSNSTGTKCEAGACSYTACATLFGDCDTNKANGCETSLAADTANCGACGTVCPSRPNSSSTCAAGTCGFTCNAGFGDCDGNAMNGCETNLATSVGNCGACGTACATTNGTAACIGGTCGVASCNAGFGNCDSNPTNGCETNTLTSVGNCGSCGLTCLAPNGTPACTAGTCAVATCNAGFANCDGNAANGCEINSNTDVNNCGTCGKVCTAANASSACNSGVCNVASCTGAFRNCNSLYADGCETNTSTDTNNCGACGNVCSVANGTAGCAGSACTVASCTGTFKNCDGVVANGCEVNSSNDRNNCGACGNVCGAGASCVASACVTPTSCQAIRTAFPTAASGTYTIDPDGAGTGAPFSVYCEMIGTEGWTLAMKANGSLSTFVYGSTHWTTSSTLNPTSTDMTLTEAKFNSYNTMPFTQLRLGMRDGGTDRFIVVTTAGASLLNRIGTLGYVATAASRATWSSLVAAPSLQPFCNQEGTNNAVGTYASVRIGLLANQENDCGSPDSFIGFGAGPVVCLGGATPVSVGNVASCSTLDRTTATWGFVFIR